MIRVMIRVTIRVINRVIDTLMVPDVVTVTITFPGGVRVTVAFTAIVAANGWFCAHSQGYGLRYSLRAVLVPLAHSYLQ